MNLGANPRGATPNPIDLLSGVKSFQAIDFELADGGLRLSRHFTTVRGGGAENTLVATGLGMANWMPGLGMELHIGDAWSAGRVGLNTPGGGHYRFIKSGTAMIADITSAYPAPSTDYSLEFVGTWPAALADVKLTGTTWIVRDPENRVWTLRTWYNRETDRWDIARPVSVVDAVGAELTIVNDAFGAPYSITDSHGRRIVLEWLVVDEAPRAIKGARLPDGTRLDYLYDVGSGGGLPYRLTAVERRDGAGALVDKTSYQYADARFPTFVTAILDKDGVVRWTVDYDARGRATSSSGPLGTDSYSVAYTGDGSNLSRTVTNALGKQATYNYVRTATTHDTRLVSLVGAASANCVASTASMTYGTDKFLATATDEEGRVTAYTRDLKGRPTQVVEAQGTAVARTTGTTWHASINAPTQIVQPGLTTNVTYAAVSSPGPYAPAYAVTQAFPYTGAAQAYTVSAGISSVTVELWGGAGGNGNGLSGAWSGAGAYVKASFAVAPGDVLTIETAGGGQGAVQNANGGAGGWPDGGPGGRGNNGSGGGGGSSRFYINGTLKAVAGGGGGSGGYKLPDASVAGAGGGSTGQSAFDFGSTGGSQTAGGIDVNDPSNANKKGRSILAFPGAQRTGGWGAGNGNNTVATTDDGGGGGGGYWGGGGGGGDGQAGGGGSSWVDPTATEADLLGGNGLFPARRPDGMPTIARGVNSAFNGPAVAGGDGHAIVRLR